MNLSDMAPRVISPLERLSISFRSAAAAKGTIEAFDFLLMAFEGVAGELSGCWEAGSAVRAFLRASVG